MSRSRGYPADWDTRTSKVYKRDNYTCQNCGVRGGPFGDTELHAHHIVPKAQGGTHRFNNLKTLCKQCHSAAHGRGKAPTLIRNYKSSSTGDAEPTTVWDVFKGIGYFFIIFWPAALDAPDSTVFWLMVLWWVVLFVIFEVSRNLEYRGNGNDSSNNERMQDESSGDIEKVKQDESSAGIVKMGLAVLLIFVILFWIGLILAFVFGP